MQNVYRLSRQSDCARYGTSDCNIRIRKDFLHGSNSTRRCSHRKWKRTAHYSSNFEQNSIQKMLPKKSYKTSLWSVVCIYECCCIHWMCFSDCSIFKSRMPFCRMMYIVRRRRAYFSRLTQCRYVVHIIRRDLYYLHHSRRLSSSILLFVGEIWRQLIWNSQGWMPVIWSSTAAACCRSVQTEHGRMGEANYAMVGGS